MFGGLCFMVDDKMCIGIVKDEVMVRIGPEKYDDAMLFDGCSEMSFTRRPMKGYVFLSENATDLDKDLEYSVQLAIDFSPLPKQEKK